MKRKVFETPNLRLKSFVAENVLCTSTPEPHFVKFGDYSAGSKDYSETVFEAVAD